MSSFNFVTDRLAIGDKSSRAVVGFSAVVSILATERPGTLSCERSDAPLVPRGHYWEPDWFRANREIIVNRALIAVPVLMIDLADGEGHHLGAPSDRFGHRVPSRGLEDFLDATTDFIADNIRRGAVLVHCGAGISRSVAVVTAYLCRYGMSLSEALTLISERRLGAAPAECFKRAIDKWLWLTELTAQGPRQ